MHVVVHPHLVALAVGSGKVPQYLGSGEQKGSLGKVVSGPLGSRGSKSCCIAMARYSGGRVVLPVS